MYNKNTFTYVSTEKKQQMELTVFAQGRIKREAEKERVNKNQNLFLCKPEPQTCPSLIRYRHHPCTMAY